MRTRGLMSCLTLTMVLGGAGCAASGPAFQKIAVPDGKSVIYAYRPSTLIGGAIRPAVQCGSSSIVLSRGGYHPFVVDPGTVLCSASTEATSEVNVDAKPGEENYVREKIGVGFFVGRPHLQVMDKETGEQEVRECKLQE
jgi:hypothetical protein